MAKSISTAARRTIRALERAVQRDEGGRGIAALIAALPDCDDDDDGGGFGGQLAAGAAALHGTTANHANNNDDNDDDDDKAPSTTTATTTAATTTTAILTGFPCLFDRSPEQPSETDGPPGAVALAHALCAAGQHVVFPIEAVLAPPLEAAAEAALAPCGFVRDAHWRVERFPAGDAWGAADDTRVDALLDAVGFVVAIERAGPSARDGGFAGKSGDGGGGGGGGGHACAGGTCRTANGRAMPRWVLAPQLNALPVSAYQYTQLNTCRIVFFF